MLIAQSPFQGIIEVSKPLLQKGKVIKMANKTNDLAHTKWMCKYHIVFTPKYRRKIIYNQYKESIRDILKQLCAYKGVEIIEGHLMPDHIHMLVSIQPKYSVSQFMGYLKGKSALMIYDKHANLKYKFGNRHFWSEGYYVPYKIGKLQIQGFSEPTTPKNKIIELSHYAEGRPVKTTGGLFAWKARKEAKIF